MCPDLPARLDIVGDGYDRAACEALVADLGLAARVRFHGWLPRSQVQDFYRSADIFVFPSYREPGGNVVFEAMGYGLPLIVSDIGGPGAAADEQSAIRIHPDSPEQYARSIASAMTRLVHDRPLRLALGDGARHRVSDVGLWETKVDRFDAICAEVISS
jgi:glycosyltransferase involved in cell wall biosynthesis